MYLEWHPTAENILLSAGYDHLIIVWNIAKGQCVNVIDCHEDTIYSMSFNRYGGDTRTGRAWRITRGGGSKRIWRAD